MNPKKRRKFLKQGAAALTSGAILSACGGSEKNVSTEFANVNFTKTHKWRMVTTWPPNFPVMGEGCNLLADWINEASGGRLEVTVYGGGELIPALESFEAVSNGVAQLGHGAGYYWSGKIAAATFFATVPFGMNAQQMNAWIMNAGGLELWEELYAPYNLIPMPAGNTGVQMGGWFNKEINSIEDLEGLKMRIPGIGGKVMSRAGASAMNVAGGEIYTNLERGVIDATEWIGPYNDFIMGYHQVADYYYYPGWHEPGTVLELLVNKEQYESLGSDLQAIVRTASYRLNGWMLSEFEARNNEYLQKLLVDEKVQLRPFPKEVLDTLRSHTDDIVGEIIANDPKAQKIFAAYDKFRKEVSNWSEISEKFYYEHLS